MAKLTEELEGDEKTGAKIILKALEAPLHQIAANAGLEGAVIVNKVRESDPGVGFDASAEELDRQDAAHDPRHAGQLRLLIQKSRKNGAYILLF